MVSAITQFFVIITCIAFAWWCLQVVRWDIFLKSTLSSQAKMLQVILSIILGYELARFILEYASLF
jgi:uncharacterized integral membrane protein (TIGR02327 family)